MTAKWAHGQITDMNQRRARNGSTFHMIKLNHNQTYFLWKPMIARNLRIGDQVRLKYRDGDYPMIGMIERQSNLWWLHEN